ncbi:18S rRNA (guanine1575-N7)-methyltransferase [Pestalotiopsis sp. IQ-011]
MFSHVLVSALIAAPLVAAHGKVSVFTGDKGGNGTALGIKGNSIANVGQNYQTEPDTTIFWSKDINTDDDFGFTDGSNGNLGMTNLDAAMALSGSALPQVSSSGGSINATLHVVTSDGAGPFVAIVDPTASGKFSAATDMEVTTQVPGEGGWIDTTPSDAALAFGNGKTVVKKHASRTIGNKKATRTANKRQTATLVDRDYNLQIAMPAGTTCTGTYNGMSNLCAVKISNNNENGPFGAVMIVQMS